MNEPSSASSRAATIRILQGQDIVTVIESFEVSAVRQQEAVEWASDHIARKWKEEPEFVAAVLLRGRERGGITSYSQWKRPVNGPAPAAVPVAWSLEVALPTFAMLDSRTYAVEFTDSAHRTKRPKQGISQRRTGAKPRYPVI